MRRYVIYYLLFSGIAALLASCSTTKNIPEDDQLFVGLTSIDYKKYEKGSHFDETQEEIEAALATQPNGALFGSSYYRTPFPYGLWVWNWADGSHGKLKKWMKKAFGKAPVLMSQVNPALRASVAQSVLRKNGYLHGRVSFTEVTQKNPKKAKIGYTVIMDSLFVVDTMSYEKFPSDMYKLIDSTREEAFIGKGMPFSVANLDAERTRLSQLMRNNGYYYYRPDYASYLADTFDVSGHVKLRLQLADSLPSEALHKWYMGNITVQLRRSFREALTDSAGRGRIKTLYSGKKSPLRPAVIFSNMKLRLRRPFSYDTYQESVQGLNATGIFSSVDFQFTPRDRDTLDLLLNCMFDKPYDFYVETNVVNRTIGRMGPELKLGFVRRNALRGGEKFDVNLHGSYEWQTTGSGSDMNSYQYGADASIEFPRILFPHKRNTPTANAQRPTADSQRPRPRRRRFYAPPSTIAKVSTDIIRRPQYYKMHIVSGEWTYRWQPSATSRHELSPLTLKYQFFNSHTERFDSLLAVNPYLIATMSDYFIPKMRYTYTYASPSGTLNPIRWETSIEESGNIVALYDRFIQGKAWNEKNKTLFENPYSQYLRFETDLTKTWTLDTRSQLVAHLNCGILWSYGNSDEAPFSEMFYVGGANSIRAFPVRSIGPGGFSGFQNDRQFSYLVKNGDSKLVMNLEYRRRLFGNLYGALFLDAGNVWTSADWSIDSADNGDEEAVDLWNSVFKNMSFSSKRFFKDIATGTGFGLRYDLDFLVLRVDWGLGLHVPYQTSKRGYFNIPRFKDMHTLHIAIGYPF